jgi:hypothetical protein
MQMGNDDKSYKAKEQEAVYTTIVGGRPPGSGTQIGDIPRGIEVLVKKASVDPEFRRLLLDKRLEAAMEIDLELSQTEAEMLAGILREQLEKIIENTKVPPEHKPVFLGKAGKLMLTVLITGTVILIPNASCAGIAPDSIRQMQIESDFNPNDPNDSNDPNSTDSGKSESKQLQENRKR